MNLKSNLSISGSTVRVKKKKKQDLSTAVCFSCQLEGWEVTGSVVPHSSDREHVRRGLSAIIPEGGNKQRLRKGATFMTTRLGTNSER